MLGIHGSILPSSRGVSPSGILGFHAVPFWLVPTGRIHRSERRNPGLSLDTGYFFFFPSSSFSSGASGRLPCGTWRKPLLDTKVPGIRKRPDHRLEGHGKNRRIDGTRVCAGRGEYDLRDPGHAHPRSSRRKLRRHIREGGFAFSQHCRPFSPGRGRDGVSHPSGVCAPRDRNGPSISDPEDAGGCQAGADVFRSIVRSLGPGAFPCIRDMHTPRRIFSDKVFKIIISSAPLGGFPAAIWRSSHVVFFDEL